MNSTFDLFDANEVAAAFQARRQELEDLGPCRVIKRQHQVQARRVKSQDELAALVPARIKQGESWHVLSNGDIDVLSFVEVLLAGAGHFDTLTTTTWRINREDIEQIERWINAGLIAEWHLIIDQRFARLAPDEYQLAKRITAEFGGSVTMCLNHSKVTLACNRADNYFLAIESSANINTNRRLEQTTIHASRELFDFYTEAFDDLRKHR